MAIVTRKSLEVQYKHTFSHYVRGFFGRREEVTETDIQHGQIHTYYVLYKDDNDETLQSIIDSLNRIILGIGTKFDELALKAEQAQPEYVDESIYNDAWKMKSFQIQGVYYNLVARDDCLELMPLYYRMYQSCPIMPCDIKYMDNGDITKEIENFIDRIKNTYSKYVKLYETRKDK